jgi:hypothetical protein
MPNLKTFEMPHQTNSITISNSMYVNCPQSDVYEQPSQTHHVTDQLVKDQ